MNTETEPQQKCNYVYIQLNSRYGHIQSSYKILSSTAGPICINL